MKRLVLSAVALSMLAVPALQSAQAAPYQAPQPAASQSQAVPAAERHRVDERGKRDGRGHSDRYNQHRPSASKPGVHKPNVHRPNTHRSNVHRPHAQKPSWHRGQRYSHWKRHQAVRDWHRHGLRRPAYGQEWVRVGNDYLLISVATGIIAGLVSGR